MTTRTYNKQDALQAALDILDNCAPCASEVMKAHVQRAQAYINLANSMNDDSTWNLEGAEDKRAARLDALRPQD